MAHELDTTIDADGNAHVAFADSQTDAWHQLGQQIGHKMDPLEALGAAHMLGWDVRKVPLRADVAEYRDDEGQLLDPAPEPVMVDVPDRFTIVRTNPHTQKTEPLGVTGRWWQPFQNEATTGLLYNITEQSGAHIETIGALDGGRKTFVTMLLPDYMTLTAPNGFLDTTKLYLAVLNHHDAQGSLRGLISPTRIVCANTQRIAEKNAVSEIRIRHTGELDVKMEEVRRILGLTFAYQETFAAEMEKLSKIERDDEWVRKTLNDVFAADDADTEKQRSNRLDSAAKVMEVYRSDVTVNMWRGTAFGAYNAVTRYLDHYAPVGNTKVKRSAERQRAIRTLQNGGVNDVKARAFELLSVV